MPHLNLRAIQYPLLDIQTPHIRPHKRPMRAREHVWSERFPNFEHLVRRQRDEVWDGPHESVRRRSGRPVDVIVGRLSQISHESSPAAPEMGWD